MTLRKLQWGIFITAGVILAGSIMLSGQQIKQQNERAVPPVVKSENRPNVTVLSVTPSVYQARIKGFGEVVARYSLNLSSSVSGKVEWVSEGFENGQYVKKGDVLAQLDQTDYLAALASAEEEVAAAQVSLLEEQRQGVLAQQEWQSSGMKGQPDSALVLRKPQLEAAQKVLKNAKSARAVAQKNLSNTQLVAPFDAVIVSRSIVPGSYLQTATEVGQLDSVDRVDVSIPLASKSWQMLPDDEQLLTGDWPVNLVSQELNAGWKGYVKSAEKHINSETRQRVMIVAVDNPLEQETALLPGTFVSADMAGKSVDHLWKLPPSALSHRGEIWYLSADKTLLNFSAVALFADADAIYIEVPVGLRASSQRVVVHPLNSYVVGMLVNPVGIDHE